MIIQEIITHNGKDFLHTYSDTNHYIIREGIQYIDAIDPIGSNRKYEEALSEIPKEEGREESKDFI